MGCGNGSSDCSISHDTVTPIKLEPFSGDIEKWARFWERYKQSIDNDPLITTINRHIFLWSFLEEEPKYLVEGIAVVPKTYKGTKKVLEARYGDKNRIIQFCHICSIGSSNKAWLVDWSRMRKKVFYSTSPQQIYTI
jgi:hypothetical protein